MSKLILVVPDPGRKKTRLQLQRQTFTDWVLTSLPCQEADYLLGILDLDGLIFEATSQQSRGKEVPIGHKMMYINEVLLMWHTIDVSPKSCLQARYMNFKTFSEIIHMRSDKLKLAMADFYAVWGGWDLTKNYREGPVLFRLSDSSRDRGDSTVCCTFLKYLAALHNMEKVLPVWPSAFECRSASYDLNIHGMLDSVARDVTFSHRPTTQAVTEMTASTAYAYQPAVLKREGAASRQHIKYPWNRKIPPNLKDTNATNNDKEDYDQYVQQYVPEWDQVGQWRCIMINKELFCTFIHPGSYMLANHDSCVPAHSLREDGWSLKELGLLRKSNPDQCNFMAREGGTRAEIALAHEEIRMFVTVTLSGMIQLEEAVSRRQDITQTSSMRVSARLDLSVITDPESQELHYFVTGISRGPGMMLYGSVDANTVRRYALEFAHPFEHWCDGRNETIRSIPQSK